MTSVTGTVERKNGRSVTVLLARKAVPGGLLGAAPTARAVLQLGLQGREEAFNPLLSKQSPMDPIEPSSLPLGVGDRTPAGVGRAVVAVVDRSWCSVSAPDRHPQRVDDRLGAGVVTDRPTHHAGEKQSITIAK